MHCTQTLEIILKETAMPTFVQSKHEADGTRLGECAATQPLSGVRYVDETFAVNGLGRGACVRREDPADKKPADTKLPS